jgi:DCN1-like protein 4/5
VPVAAPKVAPAAKSKPKVAVATPAPIKPQASISKFESYSADRAASLFKKYADEDDPTVIGPEGFETLCADAQIPLDGALPLILAWQFNGTEMAKFTKEQWTKGTDSLKCVMPSALGPR